jgi:diacylglycerol kinase (ATP)
MNTNKFSLADRFKSFRYAFAGLKVFFQTQHNARIHALATVVVVAAGFFARLSGVNWVLIMIAVAIVWMAELFNTAIEALCDMVMPEQHPKIKFIKDVAAAAVLVSAAGAIITGGIVFWLAIAALLNGS